VSLPNGVPRWRSIEVEAWVSCRPNSVTTNETKGGCDERPA
jgi:hypothetical protein